MEIDEFVAFIKEVKPIYINCNFSIQFTNYWESTYRYINTVHKGWKVPTMYNDTDPNENSGEIVQQHYDFKTNSLINGLFLDYTSDDYTERSYLLLQILDKNTIKIVYDEQHPNNENLILNRI